MDALDGNAADYGHDHLTETVKDYLWNAVHGYLDLLATTGQQQP